jgi:hypothetical protein
VWKLLRGRSFLSFNSRIKVAGTVLYSNHCFPFLLRKVPHLQKAIVRLFEYDSFFESDHTILNVMLFCLTAVKSVWLGV